MAGTVPNDGNTHQRRRYNVHVLMGKKGKEDKIRTSE